MSTTPQAAGLAATIRTWRDRLPPSALALPSGRSRRAAGLRREELADLAGISVDYLIRLEQGRATSPSAPVVAALARALQLTVDERDHLYRLAQLVPPCVCMISDHVPPGMHRLLSRLSESAVMVFAADWELVWWNRAWVALLGDPRAIPPGRRNFARSRFSVGPGTGHLAHWPVIETDPDVVDRAVVADLRRATGRFPKDPRLATLIADLNAGSERFAELWATGAVGTHREVNKQIQHPSVGPVTVDCDVLVDGDTELKIVVMSAVPGSEDESKLWLALVAGAPDATEAPVS